VMKKGDMIAVCKNFKGLVVVDEAYIDFADRQSSMLDQLGDLPNLVILQTFSKAWGMAGIRLGMAFGPSELIQALMKMKLPYNVNSVTASLALRALQTPQLTLAWVDQIVTEREKLRVELEKFSAVEKIFPSDANFLLIRIADAKRVYDQLASRGIVTRYRGNVPGCEGTIRITIGTSEQNSQLLSALKSFL
ncbi:MAG: aminotransferase class I/II-fold pyridoxal phosphate-dependent enzyme, partial [bacterium]|nr:aminotransferase class I/II-fold pyridoxal phosphate-dependent enzyme [bacterium]